MNRMILAAVMAVGMLACQGCLTYSKVQRQQNKMLVIKADPATQTLYAGVDVTKIGLAETFRADPWGTSLSAIGDAVITGTLGYLTFQGGQKAGWWGSQDEEVVEKEEEPKEQDQSADGQNGGAGGGGDGAKGGDSVTINNDGGTVIYTDNSAE